ncbi:hypothetical protein Afil01_18670 [Actinorhabdospora filicis]|uniref:Lipoprotein n=1 Tax=Actinorhabdospora filicis TaxID=1785913 RepID=A0A9W6W9X3_9ACTN|nr:hypothetical protein [Actinorhabdospora filicis]GLZ77060.1 hypothetical protein Afil01_18670 [Actinorhabdospora filicis]
MRRVAVALSALLALAGCAAPADGPEGAPEKRIEPGALYPGSLAVSFDATTTVLERTDRGADGDCTEFDQDVIGCERVIYATYRAGELAVSLTLFEMSDHAAARGFFESAYGAMPSVGDWGYGWRAADQSGRYVPAFQVEYPAGETDDAVLDRAKSLAYAVSAWFKPRVAELRGL